MYWDCVHNHKGNGNFDRTCGYGLLNSQLRHSWIDIGSVAVNAKIATDVGFSFRDFCGDWDFLKNAYNRFFQIKLQKFQRFYLYTTKYEKRNIRIYCGQF